MPMRVRCPCGRTYSVADKFAGKGFQCKECGEALSVPHSVSQRAVTQASQTGDDSGFLEMDLDAEFTRMPALKVKRGDEVEPEREFADPFERRGLRAHGLDPANNKDPKYYVPSMPLVEKIINRLLPLLGVLLGLSMIGATYILTVYYGYFWPFLGAAGIVVTIIFLNRLTSKEEAE